MLSHHGNGAVLHHASLIPAGMSSFHQNPQESVGMAQESTGMDWNGTGIDENGHFGAKGIMETLFQWTRQAVSIKLYRYCPNLQNYILLSSFLPCLHLFKC